MKEIVFFLFIQKNKVLLQYTKGKSGKFEAVEVPHGDIEEKDRGKQHASEREHALHRLMYEQSQGTVIPLQYEMVEMIDDKKKNERVYVFFIYSWDGDHPIYATSNKERIARLRWLSVTEGLDAVTEVLDAKILKTAKEIIRVRSVLHGRVYH
ncbi:MAG: hypothetical protein HYV40_03955 [Candidatus Levybacteria bacterium]|nr:hypothetical protein [Candidatus Levybacteria bacterium]